MSSLPRSKRCTKCGETKPLTEFYKDKRHSDGRRSDCKECHKAHANAYYYANREECLDYQREYYENNRGDRLAYAQRYHRDNREKRLRYNRQYWRENAKRLRRQHRQWREENPEYRREYNRQYYLENRQDFLDYRRRYYEENTEQVKETNRRWQLENPDKKRTYGHRYLARKNGADGDFTPQQLQDRISYYGGLCWMCGDPYEEIDHVIALARGGSNWPANLRPACKTCNASKGDKDWRLFVESAAA